MTHNLKKNIDLSKPTNTGQALKFSDDRQVKIWQALLLLHDQCGPDLAGMYEGIILSLQNNNPEKFSIVCHLVREFSAILPRYFPGIPVSQKSTSNQQVLKEIFKGLGSIIEVLDSDGQKAENETKIREIVEQISSDFKNNLSQRDQIKAVVNNHPKLGVRPVYLNDEFAKQWIEFQNYFTRNSHHEELRNKKPSLNSKAELEANWSAFEALIHRFLVEEPFFNAIGEIDKILAVSYPNEQNVDELIRLIVEQEHRRYFFDKSNNPDWLVLLNKKNAFSSPQEPIRRDKYIQFVSWPESQYLARIASQKPTEVYEIIKNLTTDNQSVLGDFLDAALNSPASVASQYVKLIIDKGWMSSSYNWGLPDKAAGLMEKLASEGKEEDAIYLAEEIFKLRIDEPVRISDDPDNPFPFIHSDAKPYFNEWQFGDIIQNKTTAIAINKPVELFEVYANKLHDAIRLENKDKAPEDFYESSHIWRPNLSGIHNRNEDTKNILLNGLLNLVKQYKDDGAKLNEFIGVLNKHQQPLFVRIGMFIFSLRPDIFVNEAEAILRDKKTMLNYHLRREYLPLLEVLFNKISLEAQEEILGIINSGPDIEKRDDCPQEQLDHIYANWKASYLARIEKHLPKPYQEIYQQILEKYGKTEDDDGEIKTLDGGKSPIDVKDLTALSSSEAIEYLGTYVESNDLFSSFSSNGLGIAFSNIVAENPEKYTVNSNLLLDKKIRPVYIYQFIYGLKEALKKNKCFDWNPVINFFHQLLNLNASDLADPTSQREQDWNSVRRAIADLLSEALGTKLCEIPIELRDKVWSIILQLIEDEEPTPEYEKREDNGDVDPMTLAINTVRGEAMHAVVNYGLWLSRNQSNDVSVNEIKMPPEMEEILDKHLDVSKEPSLAIRSVYGWRLPNLLYLNRDWVVSRLDAIFPSQEKLQPFLMAAMEGLMSNSVYSDTLEMLKPVYRNAIGLLDKNPGKVSSRRARIEEGLPQHLMIIYMHDSGYGDLIEYFFLNAPANARGVAINFVGRIVLRELPVYADKEVVISRVGELWEQRISDAGTTDVEELRAFGFWFKQSPFSQKDTITRLLKTLELSKGIIDGAYEVIEELQKYASKFPLETIGALDLIARAEREYNEFSYKKEEYKEIIRQVKATGDPQAVQKANDMINFLGSKGMIEFRELL